MTSVAKIHESLAFETRSAPRPLVSVIVIFLNAERFIEEAIQSVFAQTYQHWELFLVDDGSIDSSTEIARRYARLYPDRVVYLEHEQHENRGMSTSRNLGITRSSGEYIAFLDADDLWLPSKLEEQVGILDAHPEAGMVHGATEYWSSWTGKEEDRERDYVARLPVMADSLFKPPSLVAALLRNQIVTSTGGLARRQIIESVGGFEERFKGLHEDQVLYAKVCLNSPVFVSSRCWYKYRRHDDSCCAVAQSSRLDHPERLRFLKWLERYLTDQAIDDTEIWREVKRARWQSAHPALSRAMDHLRYRIRILKERLKSAARAAIPASAYRQLRKLRHSDNYIPTVGQVRLGDLRRITPISRVFGFDRGQPVDRYYIESFLAQNARDIRGSVLEIGDDSYTRNYGGERVSTIEVLHVKEGSSHATIVADLADAEHITSNRFDCIILTQTLHLIYDVRAALSTVHRILKPGGVVLATIPGISQIDHYEWARSWYWGFTSHSAQRLFGEVFGPEHISVRAYGNVLAATAFLQGLASSELTSNELDYQDRDYEVTIAVRAEKE